MQYGAVCRFVFCFALIRLMLATFSGKVDAIQLLRENGADNELRDKGGSTALHWAVDGQSAGR